MKRLAFAAVAAVAAFGGPALAAPATWLVTEENVAGVKGAQGTWTVTTDGGKVAGEASMQSGNGNMLTYKVAGTFEGSNYTVTMSDRSDGKKNCVWNGHPPSSGSAQSRGIIGYAECEGAKLIVRVSPFEN